VILFGGISVVLQHHSALFRRLPGFLDRLLDSKWALRKAAKRSISVDPKDLGEMTVAMLEGDHGPIAREFYKLEHWLAAERRPDIVNLPTPCSSPWPAHPSVFNGPSLHAAGVKISSEGLLNLTEPCTRSSANRFATSTVRCHQQGHAH
jgi:hypothetical protein